MYSQIGMYTTFKNNLVGFTIERRMTEHRTTKCRTTERQILQHRMSNVEHIL
jgi:hypothetical protein